MSDAKSPEQETKMAMLEAFNKFYSDLVGFLHKLPLQDPHRSHSFLNLDQGAYWARNAIVNAPLNFSKPEEVAPVQEQESCVVLDDCINDNVVDAKPEEVPPAVA